MRIHKISGKHVLGIESFEYDCTGNITVISGGNGVGKSSIMALLQTLLGGGNLAQLRNNNTPPDEEPEGVLVLGDDYGMSRLIIAKRGSKLTVKNRVEDSEAFKTVPAPQRFLSALCDSEVMNPVNFIMARGKDQVDILLSALPVEYDHDDLWSQMGLNPDAYVYPRVSNPIREVDGIREAIFKTRTGVNHSADTARKSAEEMRIANKIPDKDPDVGDVNAKRLELEENRREFALRTNSAKADRDEELEEIARNVDKCRRDQLSELEQYEQTLRAEMAEKISAKKSELKSELDTVLERADMLRKKVESAYEGNLSALEDLRSDGERLAEEVARLDEQSRDAIRIQTLRQQAEQSEAKADELMERSRRMTQALKSLDAYKANMIKDLPEGLTVADGEIRVNGVKWDQVNKATQARIAVLISLARFEGREFKPIFFDDAEKLDSEMFALVEREADEAGATAFFARVTSGELKVESR